MKYKYRVGQKIRVLKTNANCAQVRKGQIFTIRSIGADGINVEPTDRHFGWYFSFENIEPVKRGRPAKKMAKPKKLVDVGKTGSFTYTERATMEEMQLPDWKVSRTVKPKAEPKVLGYEVCNVAVVLVYPSNAKLATEDSNKGFRLVGERISQGFELYSAVPFSTRDTAGIHYILRKKTKRLKGGVSK